MHCAWVHETERTSSVMQRRCCGNAMWVSILIVCLAGWMAACMQPYAHMQPMLGCEGSTTRCLQVLNAMEYQAVGREIACEKHGMQILDCPSAMHATRWLLMTECVRALT
jgi:hypothetical protein